jgi:hypothetical protein
MFELDLPELLDAHERLPGFGRDAQELVELQVNGGRIAVDRVLDDEHHPEREDGRARVDLRDPESGATVYDEPDNKGVSRPASSSCVEDFTSHGLLGSFIVEGDMRP